MLVAVPGVNLVLGPMAMIVAGLRGGSGRVEPGRGNGRRAASWGLTFLLGEVLLIGVQLYIVQVVFGPGERVALFPWGSASSVRSDTDGVALRDVHRPGSQGISGRSHPFWRDSLLPLTVRWWGCVVERLAVTLGCGMWRRALGR